MSQVVEIPQLRWSLMGYKPNGWALREVHGRPERFVTITTCRQSGKSYTATMEFDYAMTMPADEKGPPVVGMMAPDFARAEANVFRWYAWVTQTFGPGYATLDKARHTATINATGAIGYYMSSSNPESLPGKTLSYLIVDEAQYVTDEAWWLIYPATSVRLAPIRCFGTPDITTGQSWYRGLWLRGRAEEKDAEAHSFTVSRYDNPHISPEEADRAKAMLSEPMYRMLYLGEWVTTEGEVFQNIENAFYPAHTAQFTPGREYVITCDPALTEDYWVLMLGEPSTGRVIAYDRWHQMPLTDAYDRAMRFIERYNRPRVVVDETGLGAGVVWELRRRGADAQGIKFSRTNKLPLVMQLAADIEHGRVRFPEEWDDLTRELKAFVFVDTPSGNVGAQAAANYHDDMVSALILMSEAFRASSGPVASQYTADSAPNPRAPRSRYFEDMYDRS